MKQRERENDNVVKMQIPQKIEYEEIETDAQDFKQRLKLLQKRAGWEPYQKPEDPVSSIEQQTNFMPVITKPSPPRRPISVSVKYARRTTPSCGIRAPVYVSIVCIDFLVDL